MPPPPKPCLRCNARPKTARRIDPLKPPSEGGIAEALPGDARRVRVLVLAAFLLRDGIALVRARVPRNSRPAPLVDGQQAKPGMAQAIPPEKKTLAPVLSITAGLRA